MIDCPFKNTCQYPKNETIKVVGIYPEKNVKVCEKCPVLYQNIKNDNNLSICLYCESTLDEIVLSQKVGCPLCYVFIKELEPIVIKSQNGNTKHTGKKSQNVMLHFFKDIIKKHIEKNSEDTDKCKVLQTFIDKLF